MGSQDRARDEGLLAFARGEVYAQSSRFAWLAAVPSLALRFRVSVIQKD